MITSVLPLPSVSKHEKSPLEIGNKPPFSRKQSLISGARTYSSNYPMLKLYLTTTSKEKILIWFSLLCAVLSGALSPVFALIAGSTVSSFSHENMIQNKTIGLVFRNSVLFGLAGITALVTNLVAISIIKYVSQKVTLRIEKAYFNALMRQELEWFDGQDTQELGRKGEMDCKLISDGTEEKMIQVVSGLASFVGGVIVSLTRGWKLTLILLSVLPFQVASALGFAYYIRKSVQSNLQAYAEAGTIAEYAFQSLGTLVSLAAEEKECARYNEALLKTRAPIKKLGFSQGICIGLFHFFIYTFQILCFMIGFAFIEHEIPGTDGIPYDAFDVITIFFAIFRGGFSLAIMGPGLKAIVEAKRAVARLFEIIDRKSKLEDYKNSSNVVLSDLQGRITFKNVVFGHSSDKNNIILKGINLKIDPGKRVVFIGKSGCGKSTLLRLILRLYDIQEGALEIDGVDITKIDLDCLRKNVSFLTQECPILTGTVRENLEMGKEDASEEEMITALRKAQAYKFIMRLEKGLDTRLGVGGISLSGGQRQRLAIARTLLSNGKIILLDEATASLDTESETELVKLFMNMRNEGKTVLMASHLVNVAKEADKVVFLEDGLIKEVGTHESLLEFEGAYCQMWRAQNDSHSLVLEDAGAHETDESSKHEYFTDFKETEINEKGNLQIEDEEKLLISRSFSIRGSSEKRSHAEVEKEALLSDGVYSKKTNTNQELKPFRAPDDKRVEVNIDPKNTQLTPLNKPRKPTKPMTEICTPRRIKSISEIIRRVSVQWETTTILNSEKKASKTHGLGRVFLKLFKHNKTLRKIFYITIFVSILNGALNPIFGFLLGNTAYEILNANVEDVLTVLHKFGIWLICIAVLTFILYTFQFASWTSLANNFNNSLRSKLFNKMLRMHIAWHEDVEHGPSALCTILSTETVNVSKLVNFVIGLLVQALSSLVTALIFGFALRWQLTLLSLIIGPLILLIIFIQTKLADKMELRTEEKKLATHILTEMVQNIATVVTLNQNALEKRYENVFRKIHRRSVLIGSLQGFLTGLNNCSIFFYCAGVFYYGAYLSSNVTSDGRDVFTVLFTTLFAAFNIFATLQLSPDIRNGFKSLITISEYLLMKSEIDIKNTTQTYKEPIKGDIEFRNVTFIYPGKASHHGLINISFKIQAGNKVALIGPNGSGKSTIFKLLLRFYDVQEGEILIDGVNIKRFNLQHLRRGLGLVEEVPRLFYGTIEYNIKCGTEHATDQDMIEAAKTSNAFEFIVKSEFRNGLESIVGNIYGDGFQRKVGTESFRLSRGQRQRISIARAIISKPRILLLDEATSAVDAQSEVLIDEAVGKVMENLTSIIISHHPTTLRKVNQILYVCENDVVIKENP